jgi:hypothetical protein
VETLYIEIHKAKELFKINEECMSMVRKLAVSPLIKTDLLTNMNKLKQMLLLQNLKVEHSNEADPALDTARSSEISKQVG